MGVCVRVRSLLFALLVLSFTPSLLARTHLSGYVEQGGQRYLNSGIFAITRSGSTQTNPYSMQSYPSATVTVYLTGTLTTATLYSDPAGTSKANPFTASSNAYWSFYIDDGTYDIRFSGGGITTPYTWAGILASSGAFTVPVTGFGAVCNGTNDDTSAIQAAINLVGGHTVTFPASTCKITDQLLIAQSYVTLQGAGAPFATRLLYMPTVGDEAAIKVSTAGALATQHTHIRGLYIFSTELTLQKTGIWVVDGSRTVIEDVQIGTEGQWTGGASVAPFTGNGSKGLYLQGRDYYRISRVHIAADIPIYVGTNPNFADIDLDHTTFDGLDIQSIGDNPQLFIADGANLTNVTFQHAAMVFGSANIYWHAGAGSASANVVFRDIRAEQPTGSGYIIDIENTSGVTGLRIEDVRGGGSGFSIKGIRLRSVGRTTIIDGFRYVGTGECINADSTVEAIDWRSSLCQASSTADLGTLVPIWSSGPEGSTPMPLSGLWLTPNSTVNAGISYRLSGTNVIAKTGTLANGATFTIPSGSGSIVTGMIMISFKGATLNGAFTCAINGARTITVATSDATLAGCTGNVPGDFTLDWVSASAIVLRNNIGETATFNYFGFWN